MSYTAGRNRLDHGQRLILAQDLLGIIVWSYDPRHEACLYYRWEGLSREEQCYAIIFAEDWWGVRRALNGPSLQPRGALTPSRVRQLDLQPS